MRQRGDSSQSLSNGVPQNQDGELMVRAARGASGQRRLACILSKRCWVQRFWKVS